MAELLELTPPPESAEHTDLFLFQLYPYASVYLGDQGKMGGEARDRIAGFWRALELSPPSEPDHLTVLLAFYSQLAEHESEAGGDDRQRWRHIRSAFLWEHLLSWLPIYLDRIDDLEPGFYSRWADILARALVAEAQAFPSPAQLPLHLREAPAITDPRRGAGDTFLDELLSPVRSGFILVRDDFVRAGHQMQLGVRAGERRYVLKALLGLDDKATLQWLAAEAARWAERHLSWRSTTGPIADFWASRATATEDLLVDLAKDL